MNFVSYTFERKINYLGDNYAEHICTNNVEKYARNTKKKPLPRVSLRLLHLREHGQLSVAMNIILPMFQLDLLIGPTKTGHKQRNEKNPLHSHHAHYHNEAGQ